MKKILVPTDFSETAGNAFRSALRLARVFQSEVFLCSAYEQPSSGQSVLKDISDKLEENTLQDLEEMWNAEKAEFPDVKVNILAVRGDVHEAVAKTAEIQKVDLIVMGKTGRSRIMNKLFGSVALNTIKESKKPLLLIPEKWHYEEFKDICFATDLAGGDCEKLLIPLLKFCRAFKSEVEIVHFAEDADYMEEVQTKGAETKKQIEQVLGDIPHRFVFGVHSNVAKSLASHLDKTGCQLVVMIKKEYPWGTKLFNSSPTLETAIATKTPLLVMH